VVPGGAKKYVLVDIIRINVVIVAAVFVLLLETTRSSLSSGFALPLESQSSTVTAAALEEAAVAEVELDMMDFLMVMWLVL
jgi:hypothetical protein